MPDQRLPRRLDHSPTRRQWLAAAGAGLGCLTTASVFSAEKSAAEAASEAMQKGFAWLLAQQADDGGWHSANYGALQGGAAMTAMALFTVAQLPAELTHEEGARWRRAFRFFDAGFGKRQTLAAADGSLD